MYYSIFTHLEPSGLTKHLLLSFFLVGFSGSVATATATASGGREAEGFGELWRWQCRGRRWCPLEREPSASREKERQVAGWGGGDPHGGDGAGVKANNI